MHTSDLTLSHKILLTWLSSKEMSKQSYLDLSSKSHKSCAKALSLWELETRTSWLFGLVHLNPIVWYYIWYYVWLNVVINKVFFIII